MFFSYLRPAPLLYEIPYKILFAFHPKRNLRKIFLHTINYVHKSKNTKSQIFHKFNKGKKNKNEYSK